ncbi:MAG: DUF362 domain-containing protein [Bacteroidales bacterium]
MKARLAHILFLVRLNVGKIFSRYYSRLLFIITGVSATIWFLVRVIPKPQRAGYPCMQAAAPLMSAFVTYVLSLGGSWLLFRRGWSKMKESRYLAAGSAFAGCLVLFVMFSIGDSEKTYSSPLGEKNVLGVLPDGANNPMGTAWGIFPGRVAWVRNIAATNEACPNTITNAYFMAKNNNQDTINKMADVAVKSIGGQANVKDSWDAIFKSFNKKKTGSETGYVTGQTIFIKVNNGQAGWAINWGDLSETGTNSSTGVKNAAMSNTTPAAVLAFLIHLVDTCGIPQNKIYVAEPMTHVYKSLYDLIHAKYPNVIVLDKDDYTSLGRTKSSGWTNDVIAYSDQGNEMPDAMYDALMDEMYDADYMINIAALKAHARAGVSLCAKLHFGSHGDHPGYGFGSFHLHKGLIAVTDNDILNDAYARVDYGMYRVLTDLMGHERLGRNTLLFVVDGLWAGIEATDMPVKWKSAPFNNDFPNSLFVSQDEVALESVCLDFLRAEATVNTAFKNRPLFPAVDDYLHQAADSANWADGITYDPEGDGSPMPYSLGVHEHWNNSTDKKYTRNLSPEGKGIELLSLSTISTHSGISERFRETLVAKAFPNPCTTQTEVQFALSTKADVEFTVVSADGRSTISILKPAMAAGDQSFMLNTGSWPRGINLLHIRVKYGKGIETGTLRILVQ